MKKILSFLMIVVLTLSSLTVVSFGADSTEKDRIKEIQQYLNTEYSAYIRYIPCDGFVSPYMCKAFIYALQALEGMSSGTVNGKFGSTTKKCCPTIPYDGKNLSCSGKSYTKKKIKKFTLLLEYALYINGFEAGKYDGIFDSDTEQALYDYQTLMGLRTTSKADLSTWMSLLTSHGNTSRKAKAADTATILTETKAKLLYENGYRYIGRYLTNAPSGYNKAITKEEAEIIFSAGLNFFPIYQTTGRSYSYFTAARGTDDASKAVKAAKKLGLPGDTVIYFAVDYDVTPSQMKGNILSYFKKIKETMKKTPYKVGIYGSKGVCLTVSEKGYADYSFVSGLSTGFYGNCGYKMPDNWTFNQYSETVLKGSGTYFAIDKNDFSGLDEGVSYLNVKHSHSYEATVTKKATCSKKGKKVYTCSCGDSYTSSIAKKKHTPVIDEAVSPTYKKTGLTEGSHCKVCGTVIKAQETVKRKTLSKVKNLRASKTSTSYIKLTWKKVKGAKGYKVSYSTDGKKWTTVKTDEAALTVKNLKSGKNYRFKVRAFTGSNKGSYSSVLKTATKVGTVKLKSVKSAKRGTLTATWTKLSGADGYRLYLSTSEDFTSETTKKVTVKNGKTVKATVKSLKKNKRYYVKLRGYKTVNDKKVYGAFSSVQSVKVKK